MSLIKGWLISFCSGRPKSQAVGDGFMGSSLMACIVGSDNGSGAVGRLAESSICMGNDGDSCVGSGSMTGTNHEVESMLMHEFKRSFPT